MHFNRYSVKLFYDNLADVMGRFKFEPYHIYNVDERNVATVYIPAKVMALKIFR